MPRLGHGQFGHGGDHQGVFHFQVALRVVDSECARACGGVVDSADLLAAAGLAARVVVVVVVVVVFVRGARSVVVVRKVHTVVVSVVVVVEVALFASSQQPAYWSGFLKGWNATGSALRHGGGGPRLQWPVMSLRRL
mmetsp:Transcript_37900/g.98077  ORF Transcript_37900/g.98077 Transcript_37900/m.98077 type:complete len:137 (-) Transcript_37900:814-1224(-)